MPHVNIPLLLGLELRLSAGRYTASFDRLRLKTMGSQEDTYVGEKGDEVQRMANPQCFGINRPSDHTNVMVEPPHVPLILPYLTLDRGQLEFADSFNLELISQIRPEVWTERPALEEGVTNDLRSPNKTDLFLIPILTRYSYSA
eukprot:Blabericola_migrator_1__6354@NODE_3202_length_1950_cov_21_450876_g2003_i0_p2_GENE_NODE_3202_length_1950_cov_21_450876_g2003_i0NODE_3202_length_1950_cov_21_450876_g2003_i0_p2_ORF_typecomplete_len144_score10_45_NODE_3202_length_1950_cov_21_450876_g2003_i08721303